MSGGPGKYDDLCTAARDGAKAKGAILLVVEGDRGSGFSVQAPLRIIVSLPNILRTMADQIEADNKKLMS